MSDQFDVERLDTEGHPLWEPIARVEADYPNKAVLEALGEEPVEEGRDFSSAPHFAKPNVQPGLYRALPSGGGYGRIEYFEVGVRTVLTISDGAPLSAVPEPPSARVSLIGSTPDGDSSAA